LESIAAAELGGHGDFLDQARPDLAALGVSGGFLVFDVGPFGMTGHVSLRGAKRIVRRAAAVGAARAWIRLP
jgi:hypothetical protein